MKIKQIVLAISIIVIYSIVIKRYNGRFPTEDHSIIEINSMPVEDNKYVIRKTLSLDYPNIFQVITNNNPVNTVMEVEKSNIKESKRIQTIERNIIASEIKGIVNTKKMGHTVILTTDNKIEKLKTGDTINGDYIITGIDAQSVKTRSISLKKDTILSWTK